MYTSWISYDLMRVNEEQTVRATRFTWQRAELQRRPGRWVANVFRQRWPGLLHRRGQPLRVEGKLAAEDRTLEPVQRRPSQPATVVVTVQGIDDPHHGLQIGFPDADRSGHAGRLVQAHLRRGREEID